METVLYLLYQVAGLAPMIPLDQQLRPTWLFGKTVHEGCDRGSYYEQGDFATHYGSSKCLVKLGCWGPVVDCNVTKRGWMRGIGGCPNVGGICIGCTMPGLPGQVHALYGRTAGSQALHQRHRHLWPVHPHHAQYHQHDAEQRTEMAASQTATNDRVSADYLLSSLGSISRPNRKDHAMATYPETIPEIDKKKRNLVEMNWDPITRIVGSLGIFTKIDFENREVAECHSTSSIFRGYSIFMKGKDPRDAHFITSRICGICGDNHATCAVYAQNMAFGIKPPPHGRVDHQPGRSRRVHVRPQHLPGQPGGRRFLRADGEGNQSWRLGQGRNPRLRPNGDKHGYRTIADIMTALNPFTGTFYRETLAMSRMTREMFCLMEGRHVHPSTLYPGGVGTVPTVQLFTDYLVRLMKYVEFMKKVVPLHDDLFDFFYEALPGYEKVGQRRVLLAMLGIL